MRAKQNIDITGVVAPIETTINVVDDILVAPEEAIKREEFTEVVPTFIQTKFDERDELDDYEDAYGSFWLKSSTKWILPMLKDEKIRSPNDFNFLKKAIHESAGLLNSVLKKMNWHISCKAELIRWIRKMDLANDLMVARQGVVDEAEEIVRQGLASSDIDTAKFVLKTMGKKRGWSERDNIEHKEDVFAFISVGKDSAVVFTKLSDYELTKALEDKIKGL